MKNVVEVSRVMSFLMSRWSSGDSSSYRSSTFPRLDHQGETSNRRTWLAR